jgi:hypothetical protein
MRMAPTDDEASWVRQLVVGLSALVVISLLVGAVIGAIAFAAARMTGIDGTNVAGPTRAPSLVMPTGRPSTSPQAVPDPPGGDEPTPEQRPTTAKPSPIKRPKPITLQVFPARVAPGERINLTGVYQAGEGATLQVQRFEGGWTDFPVTVRVSGGTFSTYVLTSRTGPGRWRVTDLTTGRSSQAVRVTVR